MITIDIFSVLQNLFIWIGSLLLVLLLGRTATRNPKVKPFVGFVVILLSTVTVAMGFTALLDKLG